MRFGKTDAARVAAIGLVASIGGAVALWPRLNHHPLLSPWAPIVNRMAGHAPDQAEPPFHTRVDVAAFGRAAAIITPLSLLTLAGIRPTLAAFLVVASLISLLGWWFGRRSSVRSPAANVRERGAATVFAAAAAAAVIVLCVLTWLAALRSGPW